MSATAEARELVGEIAGPLRLGDNVKAALARVSRATGLGCRRVRGIWNGEARSIRSEEMDRLRLAATRARAARAAKAAALHQAAHGEYDELLRRLTACEEALGLHRTDVVRAVDQPGG